jgi:hypothetical protein
MRLVDDMLSALSIFYLENICSSVLRNAGNHLRHYTMLSSKFLSRENIRPHTSLCESTNIIEINFGPMGVILKGSVEKSLYSKHILKFMFRSFHGGCFPDVSLFGRTC